MKIALQTDYLSYHGREESYSARWDAWLRNHRHEVKTVDVYSDDVLEQIKGCDGFMWRFTHGSNERDYGVCLMRVIEEQLGMAVFPDTRTSWHYDDKVAQHYLLAAAGIPMPKTWTYWKREQAEAFAEQANYPLVLKLAGGAGSQNVKLVSNRDEAFHYINMLFGHGCFRLDGHHVKEGLRRRLKGALKYLLHGSRDLVTSRGFQRVFHKNYILFQEFLPGNSFDTRVTVIGNRAFAYRRFNRPGDFRASGSGNLCYNRDHIAEDFIRLAFQICQTLGLQTVAIDGLRNHTGQPVTAEISYTYVSEAVHECAGYWELDGKASDGNLNWIPGSVWPEHAIAEDFIQHLKTRQQL